jgi:hypothetical protein
MRVQLAQQRIYLCRLGEVSWRIGLVLKPYVRNFIKLIQCEGFLINPAAAECSFLARLERILCRLIYISLLQINFLIPLSSSSIVTCYSRLSLFVSHFYAQPLPVNGIEDE